MSSGNEFHSTGPAQEKDRRPYRSSLWRGTHNRALSVDLRAYTSRARRPTPPGGGRLVLGVLELLSTINIVEENGVAIGAFDFESGNFVSI